MDGILLIDKPAGITSYDVIRRLKKKFMIKKIGHAGTLDPFATGLLIVLIGSATKLSSKIMDADKEYIALMRLGIVTDTGDLTGKVLSEYHGDIKFNREELESVFSQFTGEILQVPHRYSAVKKDGMPLYYYARKGIEVEIKPRPVMIHEIALKEISLPDVLFKVRCGKGVYIRSLAQDIGEALGCGAVLMELRRLRIGRFSIEGARDLTSLLENESNFGRIDLQALGEHDLGSERDKGRLQGESD